MNTQTILLSGNHTRHLLKTHLSLKSIVTALPKQIYLLWQRQCQRRQLMTLEDHLLKDVGISRADAVREGQKPFWKD
ncbi:MAG: DUF1127 domain-containing protein [Sedimenticola sp.]